MPDLSLAKMKEIKKSKGYTYQQIADLTGISRSTIEKIFSGANNNPTLTYLKKIANVLDCQIDDFIEYESEPISPYYLDRKTAELAQEIFDNYELRVLLDASRKLSQDDIKAVVTIVNKIKGNLV